MDNYEARLEQQRKERNQKVREESLVKIIQFFSIFSNISFYREK